MKINYNVKKEVPFSEIENGQSFVGIDRKVYVKFYSEVTKEPMALHKENAVAIRMDDDVLVTPCGTTIKEKVATEKTKYFSDLKTGDFFRYTDNDCVCIKVEDDTYDIQDMYLLLSENNYAELLQICGNPAARPVIPLNAELTVSELD